MAFHPVVNNEKCTGCEACVQICPIVVFEMKNDKSSPERAAECLACESCVEVCEDHAVMLRETEYAA